MNRRNFFRALGAGVIAVATPEILLPKRTYFLPPRGGWAWDRYAYRASFCQPVVEFSVDLPLLEPGDVVMLLGKQYRVTTMQLDFGSSGHRVTARSVDLIETPMLSLDPGQIRRES